MFKDNFSDDYEENREVLPYLNDNIFKVIKKVLVSWQGLGTENYYNRITYEVMKELQKEFNIKEKIVTWDDFKEFEDDYKKGMFNGMVLMKKGEQLDWFLKKYPQFPINRIKKFIGFYSIIQDIFNQNSESEDF